MRRSVIGLFVTALMCALPGDAAAQTSRHPMYLVRQEFVRPSQIPMYEEETRRYVLGLDESNGHAVQWVAVHGPELGYSYVVPIDNFGEIDLFRDELALRAGNLAARFERTAGVVPSPVDHIESFVISLRPDLSYLPRTVALDLELPFRKYHWYHVIPGMETAFASVARRLVELHEEHDIEHGFRIYESELGDDLPLFLLVERAADATDYAVRTAAILTTVGDDADALRGEMMRFTRRLEVMEGVTRGDLSFPPLSSEATEDLVPDS